MDSCASRAWQGPLGNHSRFRVLSAADQDNSRLTRLGTYGFIKHPAAFLVGAASRQPNALVDFGYCMEQIILKATELAIGTCWLGVTFTSNRFSSQIDLDPRESIPAVASLGYPADHRAWMDRVSRIYAGSDHRLPWETLFFQERWDKPLPRDETEAYLEPLQLVRLAPSASNKQPWRLLFDGEGWHFYLKRTPHYPPPAVQYFLPIADLQRIDMGIALAHFSLGLEEAGIGGKWMVEDPGLNSPENSLIYIITWKEDRV